MKAWNLIQSPLFPLHLGEGAIAIVRISGDEAIEIADKIFRGPGGKSLLQVAFPYDSLWSFN